MKKSIKWLIILAAFVAALAAISILYDSLSEKFAPDRITQIGNNDLSNTDNNNITNSNPPDNNNSETQSQYDTEDETVVISENHTYDFTMLDQNGNTVKLSDYFGKPIVLNFWATWCYYCVMEMPDFDTAYKENPDIQFMMVNVTDGHSETVEGVKKFIEEKGFSFPVFFDTSLEGSNIYGASNGVPMTFFISANGELIAYSTGALDEQSIKKCIEMIKQ